MRLIRFAVFAPLFFSYSAFAFGDMNQPGVGAGVAVSASTLTVTNSAYLATDSVARVGIGVTSPTEKLEVSGVVKSTGLWVNGFANGTTDESFKLTGPYPRESVRPTGSRGWDRTFSWYKAGDMVLFHATSADGDPTVQADYRMYGYPDGNIGIGNVDPRAVAPATLAVAGSFRWGAEPTVSTGSSTGGVNLAGVLVTHPTASDTLGASPTMNLNGYAPNYVVMRSGTQREVHIDGYNTGTSGYKPLLALDPGSGVQTAPGVGVGIAGQIGTGAMFQVQQTNLNAYAVVVSSNNNAIMAVVDKVGNLGIGTASPSSKLHMSSGTLTIDGNTPIAISMGSGLCQTIAFTNHSGITLASGTIVSADDFIDLAITTAASNSLFPMGMIQDAAGCADGAVCQVGFAGVCLMKLKGGESCDHATNHWAATSDTAGFGQCDDDPVAHSLHSQEVGHYVKANTSGTVYVMTHFN